MARRFITYRTLAGYRTAKYKGQCLACSSPLYVFADGESGPKGATPIKPKNYYEPIKAADFGQTGGDLACCLNCSVSEVGRAKILELGKLIWTWEKKKSLSTS